MTTDPVGSAGDLGCGSIVGGACRAADAELEAVLDEARLDPAGYALPLDRSLLAALARRAATAAGVDPSAWARHTPLEDERRRRGLLEPDAVDAWLEERGLAPSDVPVVADRLAARRWARGAHRDVVAGEVALTVRSDASHAELAGRAARKPALDAELVEWHFGSLDQEVTPALDAWTAAQGWRRVPDFLRPLGSEWRVRAAEEARG